MHVIEGALPKVDGTMFQLLPLIEDNVGFRLLRQSGVDVVI
tara:strand:+ start:191 stop:313 length:123 start_codon:yes stop_codon:yes gene_type:complete